MGMVINGLKSRPIGCFAAHKPLGSTVIDLSAQMAFLDRLFDIRRIKLALLKTHLGVASPDEVIDPTKRAYAAARRPSERSLMPMSLLRRPWDRELRNRWARISVTVRVNCENAEGMSPRF
jgi:hypothetical protein